MAFKQNMPECPTCTCGGGTVPSILCGGCLVPTSLTCVWQYRAVTAADFANCDPNAGNGITTLTIPMNYVSNIVANFTGWFSDWFQVGDRQYFCSTYFTSSLARIDPAYWVRLQMVCVSGTYGIYYAATATKDPNCSPQAVAAHACTGGLNTTSGQTGATAVCSPFHLHSAVFSGPASITPGRTFEIFDVTS